MSFSKAVARTLSLEGAYNNDPDDPGGETNFGITFRVARVAGYTGNMSELTLDEAIKIYKRLYWDVLLLDQVDPMAPRTALELFDTSVNMGAARAGTFLQRALNSLDPNAKLAEDGQIGPGTLIQLKLYINRRSAPGDLVLARLCDAQQGHAYLDIARNNLQSSKFLYGWANQRLGVE